MSDTEEAMVNFVHSHILLQSSPHFACGCYCTISAGVKRQFVAEFGNSRQKRRLSPKTATVGDLHLNLRLFLITGLGLGLEHAALEPIPGCQSECIFAVLRSDVALCLCRWLALLVTSSILRKYGAPQPGRRMPVPFLQPIGVCTVCTQ